MLKRFFRVIVAILTLGLVRLEKSTAGARRERLVDEKVQQVAKAREGLGKLQGEVRRQARTVQQLEERKASVERRKAHFLQQLTACQVEAEKASLKAQALEQHREVATIVAQLNQERGVLAQLTNEYEASKALIRQASSDVKEAKKRGRDLSRRKEAAGRRRQLAETTTSLRGLGGVGDELAVIDDEIESTIDGLEGAAFVAAEVAAESLADRHLDAQIALSQADADFEAELAVADAAKPGETPALAAEVSKPDIQIPLTQDATPAAGPEKPEGSPNLIVKENGSVQEKRDSDY